MNKERLKLIIKSRSFRFPRPTRWPKIGLPRLTGLPTVGLANKRIKYIVAGSVGLSMIVVAVGMY